MEQHLQEKTGKTLDEWKRVLAGTDLDRHGAVVTYLKTEHGVTHGYANFIALKYREADADSHDPAELVNAQYGGKESLRPIYERLHGIITALGDDVEIAPKKSAVSFRRQRQFALVQPSTKTRVDLGLKFDDRPQAGRLEASGPFGTMCTHRVQLTEPGQVDQELEGWLREAYEQAG